MMHEERLKLISVSFESRAVCYIQLFRKFPDGARCGAASATGFHWSFGGKLYLITNRHNVTGLDPTTGNPVGSFTPTHMHVWFNEMADQVVEEGRRVIFAGKEIALFDSSDVPVWLEHHLGSQVDIVAIPIEDYDFRKKIYTVNQKQQLSDFHPMCGDDCFIVGYPEGLSGPSGTPIWKRASIATEPELDYDNKPLFLADSLTRKGMSGSPVFARVPGLWGQEGAQLSIGGSSSILGYWTKFIGVYAGREASESEGFQLARVWKHSVLNELISSGVTPRNPHL
ncbi:serine protease [Rhodobacteraceae bacterium M385]|nr:serine protease [Rhodobacteraceae bacterium M385]